MDFRFRGNDFILKLYLEANVVISMGSGEVIRESIVMFITSRGAKLVIYIQHVEPVFPSLIH